MIIGFANGCFDLFHEGHRHYLTTCRRHCDYLIVAVNSDDYCRRVKGTGRPYQKLQARMMHVRAFAEAVIPFEGREGRLLMEIRPNIVFKGGDHGHETVIAARVIGWKTAPVGQRFWRAKVMRIDRLPDISTTLEAQRLGLHHERETDAGSGAVRQP